MSGNLNRRRSRPRKQSPANQWRRMDLHLHTPGSNDYQQHEITYLDILRQAEARGLDIIAFTDHNTVAGFAALKKEVEQLLWLEQLGRMEPEEKRRLDEYRRLLEKVLVLPGFEFTATFGFHILGIFPRDIGQLSGTSTADIEGTAPAIAARQCPGGGDDRCADGVPGNQ